MTDRHIVKSFCAGKSKIATSLSHRISDEIATRPHDNVGVRHRMFLGVVDVPDQIAASLLRTGGRRKHRTAECRQQQKPLHRPSQSKAANGWRLRFFVSSYR